MERHVERLTKFQETGQRLLPPPPMLDLDPVIPPYEKFGNEGHLYIVKPPQDPGDRLFKVGSTTQLLKRMYWYEPGTELLFSIYVPEKLRIMERQWIHELNKDPKFTRVKGREYFTGSWEDAVKVLTRGSAPAPRPPELFS
jgi:T5orf172 domain